MTLCPRYLLQGGRVTLVGGPVAAENGVLVVWAVASHFKIGLPYVKDRLQALRCTVFFYQIR